ncbi:MAG: 30S ribosomal protein S6 [Candidatus Marinimicrobia bacterium]|nr:30S ribosomal protein S6 [Candidatus Neomarinimicrobiota bacterium]
MNYYETLYIVHPSLEAGRLKDIIMGVEESLKKMGGSPLAMELWGKRKLAYFIDKQKYGTYVLLHYNGEGKCTGEFAVELEHNPNILAYLTTSIEKESVMEQTEDLDAQIAGKSREAERRDSRTSYTENTKSASPEASVQEGDTNETASNETTSEGGDEKSESETETKESDNAEDNNIEETAEVEEVKADKEPVEAAENESDEEKTTDDETTSEEETESKQENADETTAVSEEE